MIKINCNFLGGGGCKTTINFCEGSMDINFSETAHSMKKLELLSLVVTLLHFYLSHC